MFDRILVYFKSKHELEHNNALLEHVNSTLEGRIEVLERWNQKLQEKNDNLEQMIFRKFGLITPSYHVENGTLQPLPQRKSWPAVKAELEEQHKTKTPEEIQRLQEYWANKLKEQDGTSVKG